MNRIVWAVVACLLPATAAVSQTDFNRWADFYDAVKKDLRSESVATQVAAIAKFESEDYDKSAEFLVKLIQKNRSEPAVLRKAAEVLAGFKNERAARMLEDTVKRNPGGDFFLLLAYLLKKTDDGPAVALKALESARSPGLQKIAIEGLALQDSLDPSMVQKLIGYLDEKHYHSVRKASADALGRIAAKEQVVPLIQALNDKVIGDRARDALLRLTGEQHWRDTAAWQEWWKANAATFAPQPMADADFETLHAKLMEEKGDNAMAVEFYEREITGKNIVFLLDRSGSMSTNTPESGISRMEKLKSELGFVLDRLDEGYSIGFVMFPMDTFPTRGIDKMDDRFRKKAQKYVEGLAPTGSTPLGQAVEHAYSKIVPKENVDTIYLLSDGAPSDVQSDELLQMIVGYTDRYGVTVNTISIGTNSQLLQDVAKVTGGQYWEAQ
ncbi:MAG: VWA domain-containing protein [Verrucomicrobiales bacterium]|nr:VWA domain-containing protein [Verrucomicrobiales bacterium]